MSEEADNPAPQRTSKDRRATRRRQRGITLRPSEYVPLDPEHEREAIRALARLLALSERQQAPLDIAPTTSSEGNDEVSSR